MTLHVSRAVTPAAACECAARYVRWLCATGYAVNTVQQRRQELGRFVQWCDVAGVVCACDVTHEVLECQRAGELIVVRAAELIA